MQEEEEGLDEFLSEHGFEYVDGDRGGRQPTQDGESISDEADSGTCLLIGFHNHTHIKFILELQASRGSLASSTH